MNSRLTICSSSTTKFVFLRIIKYSFNVLPSNWQYIFLYNFLNPQKIRPQPPQASFVKISLGTHELISSLGIDSSIKRDFLLSMSDESWKFKTVFLELVTAVFYFVSESWFIMRHLMKIMDCFYLLPNRVRILIGILLHRSSNCTLFKMEHVLRSTTNGIRSITSISRKG